MIEKIQKATASSPEGAKGLVKGILACAFQNMAFMLPTSLLYCLVRDLMAGTTVGRAGFYTTGCIGCFALIFLTTWFQYNGTYFATYKESASDGCPWRSGCGSSLYPSSESGTWRT